MKLIPAALGFAAAGTLALGGTIAFSATSAAAAGMPVFDATNYAEPPAGRARSRSDQ